jgi:hypothetical protein
VPFTPPPTAVPLTVIQAQHRNVLRDNQLYVNALMPSPTAANQLPILTGPSAGTWAQAGTGSFVGGGLTTVKLGAAAITTAKIQDGGIDAAALSSSAQAAMMPGKLVLMVRTIAELPAGWARETALDGRFAINAGTTFTVAFAEATDYGSSWAHAHGWSGTTGVPDSTQANIATVTPQQVDAASTGHFHTAGGTSGSTSWTIPSRAYVWIRRA